MIPTVSFFPEIIVSTEGDSFTGNFVLDQPVPSGGLTLNLVLTQNTEPKPGDVRLNIEASSGITDVNTLLGDNGILLGFALTLAEGITQAQFVGETIVNDILETDEIGTNTLADGEDYRANPNQNSLDAVFTDRTVVTLTTDEVNITEGDTFAWNFSLNRPAPEGGLTLSLPITLNNDPEPGDVDYNVEGSTNIEDFGFITQDDVSVGFTLTIPEGETSATLVSQAVVDDIAEFDEIFTTVLADGNDYVANPVSNQVVTTIVEDGVAPPSEAPIVSITPQTLIATEGDTFAWDFTLDKPVPEGGLTLSLPITQNNDPEPGDVIYNVEGSTGITDFDFIVEDDISIGFSVTLEEGVTSATVVSEAVVDDNDLEEFADEIFTTVLADGVDYRANPDSNEVQTFITGQTVVSFTPEQVSAAEGDTFAWNFSLNRPAPEGGLNLSLPITFNNDPEPGDVIYNVEGSTGITDFDFLVVDNISIGFTLTIAEGETEATLVSQAVADDLIEIDEIFTTVLNDGDGYRANPVSREVVTTIVETSVAKEISGTTKDDNLYGTNDAEIISGDGGDDNISGNGGGDTLIGGTGDDDIYGSFEADEISGGTGDDFIFGNGGNDLIDSGLGFDSVFLGAEETTVVLDKGEGFDTIFNFQLGATKFEVSSLNNLSFTDSDAGAEIFLEGDKLAVVAGQSANTFSSNQDMIFAV